MNSWIRFFLLFMLWATARVAEADRQKSAYYGLLGAGGSLATFKPDGSGSGRSHYRGYGFDAEAGLDLNFNGRAGLNVAGLAQFSDYTNRSTGSSFSETGQLRTYGGKVGVFFGPLTVGGGYRQTEFVTEAIDTTGAYNKTELLGDEQFGFVNLVFDSHKKFRSMVEISYATGHMGSLKTSQINVFIRIGIMDEFGR